MPPSPNRNRADQLGTGAASCRTAVRTFIQQVRRLPDFRSPILWARARRFRNRPFAVITDLILNHADIDPRKPAEAIQQIFALADLAARRGDAGEATSLYREALS